MKTPEVRWRLRRLLRLNDFNKENSAEIVNLICTLINDKISSSEGKHHSKFHKVKDNVDERNNE